MTDDDLRLYDEMGAGHVTARLINAPRTSLADRRIRIGDEWMYVQTVSHDDLIVFRGCRDPFGRLTDAVAHHAGDQVFVWRNEMEQP